MSDQYPGPQVGFAPDIRPISGLAIASLVLGVLFLCLGPLGLVPLILGIIAITMTGQGGPKRGMGLAIAGTVLGSVAILGTCLSIGILLPSLAKAKMAAKQLLSQTQIRMIVQEAIVYASDHEEMYPPVEDWPEAFLVSGNIDQGMLVSPAEDGDGVSYIYLGGENTFDASQIVIYEDPKHFGTGVLVGFADGSVEMISFDMFDQMLADQLAETQP